MHAHARMQAVDVSDFVIETRGKLRLDLSRSPPRITLFVRILASLRLI